jgi:hypothetical protein
MDLKSVSPFLEPSFIEWVTSSTTRADCISEMPIELSPTTEKIMHTTGKSCLRNAFPDSLSAYRRKDPIEVNRLQRRVLQNLFSTYVHLKHIDLAFDRHEYKDI